MKESVIICFFMSPEKSIPYLPERMTSKTLYVDWVRHIPTPQNYFAKVQGAQDGRNNSIVLTDSAKHLRERFIAPHTHYDLAVTSDYKRTHQTLILMQEEMGFSVDSYMSNPLLNERFQGILEGQQREVVKKILKDTYGIIVSTPEEISDVMDNDDIEIDGQEKMVQVQKRVDILLNELATWSPGAHVLIVTHGGVMKALGLDAHKVNRTKIDIQDNSVRWNILDTTETCRGGEN
jgi:broad specificity phosphatase PhoE